MGEATRAEARAPGAKKENLASQKQNSDLSQSISSPAEQILFLQRTIGNQAVGRLIRSGALKSKPEEKKDQTLQTRPLADSITPVVQRQMVKDREEETEPIQAKSAESRDNNLEEGADVETQINLSKGHGSPLPDPVRSYMEPRFGVDFSKVRVHTDSDAIQMNLDVKAQAFTHGTDIYFGADHSPTNSELTAHELTHVVQQTGRGAVLDTPAVQRRDASEGGKRMYRTTDGKMVELPPDMTAEDAARLEAEGKAAEKKLGKRPPPKPLSEVKKPTRKEEKEVKPEGKDKKSKKGKGRGKSKSKGKSKGKIARKGGGAAMLEAVGYSEVAQYLTKRGASVLIKGMGRLQKLKQNEQTHDNAAEKLKQSEKAVFTPPSEGQSQSNAAQVNAVSAKPVPTVDEKRAKKKLQESLIENIPETIEDVDNFKRDKKAQRMGADVMKVVQGDKNAVISTFGDMEHTPPPIPPKHTPEALPPKEIAPHTANMYLGRNAIAPLQKEHTDLSNYTGEAENKLKEEDITQEQLDMVDSGDLAEANKEKKGMEKTAKSEPLAVQKFAQQETKKVEKDLRQEEKKQRNELKVKRKASLGATLKQQKGTKTAIEKQRDEVANKINGIYRSAQDKVKKKLNDLEKNSMKRFDEGNNKATKKFEDNVKREINAYKKKRYSGWFGWTKKAKDWILGMDKLPKVKAIFESNRTTFVNTINKLVENITTDNKRVVQECKDELANARVEIKEFVDKLGPALKDIGKKAAEEMNNKLDDLDQFVAKKEQELQYKLKDKQQAAIKAIDEKIEKMKEAMSGALAKLGKLLLKAAKKFFSWALQKFGYSLEKIDGIINKGAAVLKAIFTKPIKFVKNLVSAAGTGFKNFGKNFLKHLKNAVFAWLTGSLVGIILPERWDLKGIMSVVFQMLGITYQNIRSHIVKLIPEPVVKTMETTFTLVKNLITKGPMAVWEQLKGMAESIKNTFVNAIKDWIKWKVVEEAIKTILSMLIPGAGIVRAIVGIYDTIVFFIQKAKDIMQMLGNFLGSIAQIAAGNISSAAEALENGLARGLKLVIEFLAKFLHLSGITQKIRDVIQKIRGKVDNVIAKVAKWIVAKAKKVYGKVIGGVKKGKEAVKAGVAKVMGWLGLRKRFTSKHESHELYFVGKGAAARLVVASSDETKLEKLLAIGGKFEEQITESEDKTRSKALTGARQKYQQIVKAQNTLIMKPDDANAYEQLTLSLNSLAGHLAVMGIGLVCDQPLMVDDVVLGKSPERIGSLKLVWSPGIVMKVDPIGKTFKWQSSNLEVPRTAVFNFNDINKKWKRGHISQVKLSEERIIEENKKEKWDDIETARKVLNYRYHGIQTNPDGKQWEHIIERSAGEEMGWSGTHSSGNLALTSSTINNRLGKLFEKAYASYDAPSGLPGTGGKELREFLKGKSLYIHNRWKNHFYSTEIKASLGWKKSKRGRWRELE